MKRKLLCLGTFGCFCLLLLVTGCRCEQRCDPCPQKVERRCEEVVCQICYDVVVPSEPLNCPACKDQVTIYTRDGQAEVGCPRCEVAKREKPCIECRPPKATPKASPCPPCPPCQ